MKTSILINKEKSFELLYMDVSVMKSVSGDDDWIIEGIASTTHTDLYGDVVLPKSFSESLDFFKEHGKIFYEHGYIKKDDTEGRTPVGLPLSADLVNEGLHIKLKLNKEHPISQKIWKEVFTNPDKDFRNTLGLSIGAKSVGKPERKWDSDTKKFVNYLPELILYEVSLTPRPVNPHTKTWVSYLKSIIKEETIMPEENKLETLQLESGELIEKENGQIFIKSTFLDADDKEVEVLIPVKKDDVLKAFPVEGEEKKEETSADEVGAEALGGNEETTSDPTVTTEEAKPEKGVGEAVASTSAETTTDAGGENSTPLEAVATENGETVPQNANTEEQPDAALALVHDKMDTLLEMLQNIMTRMDSQSATNNVQTTEVVPTDVDQMKSFISEELSKVSENLTNVVKSSMTSENIITKSVGNKNFTNPNVVLSNILMEDGTAISVNDVDVKDLTLKSLLEEYDNVTGTSIGALQKRLTIKSKLKTQYGLTENQIINRSK